MSKIIFGGLSNRNQGAQLYDPQPQANDILHCGQVAHHYGGGGGIAPIVSLGLDIATGGATSFLCALTDTACVICAVDSVACILCSASSVSDGSCVIGSGGDTCITCYGGCGSCTGNSGDSTCSGGPRFCTTCYSCCKLCTDTSGGCTSSGGCSSCVYTSVCLDCQNHFCQNWTSCCKSQLPTETCGGCFVSGNVTGCVNSCGPCICNSGDSNCIGYQTNCSIICCDKGYGICQTCVTSCGTSCAPCVCNSVNSNCMGYQTNCSIICCDKGYGICNTCTLCNTCLPCCVIPTCESSNSIICCDSGYGVCNTCTPCDSCLPCCITPSCETPGSCCISCCGCDCTTCCTNCCTTCCNTCCTDCCACCNTCCCDTSCCNTCCNTCCCDTSCCGTCCCDVCCCDTCCCDTCCCDQCCCTNKCKTKKPKGPTGKKPPKHKPVKNPKPSSAKGQGGPSALCGIANLLKAGSAKKALELAKLGTGKIGENIGGLSNASGKVAACQIAPCKMLGYGCLAEGGLFHAAVGGKAKTANLAKLTTNRIGDSSNLLGTTNQRTMGCQLFPNKGLGYGCLASGGEVHHFSGGGTEGSEETCICKKIQAIKDATSEATKSKNDAFDISKYETKFACSQPEILVNRGSGQHFSNTPLSHIYQGITGHAEGGGLPAAYHSATPKGHNPEFITGVTGYYACGGGTGQSDDIPAMLHDGDYVMDAETVSALGDGSSKAGKKVLDGFRTKVPHHVPRHADGGVAGANPVPAKIADGEYVFPAAFVTALGRGDNKRGAEILDGMREKLRAHKRNAPLSNIPPKAKSPLDYIKKGTK